MNEITLNLTVEETNLMLNAVGNMPFTQVHQLVQKIQTQAGLQLQEMEHEEEPVLEENGNKQKKKS